MDLNPFRLCSGLKILGYFMIILVFAIVAVSYYAVVVLTWGPHLFDGGSESFFSFLIIILFHMLLVLLTWSYLMVVFCDPGSVPANWKLISDENLEEGSSVPISDNLACDSSISSLQSTDRIQRTPAVRYCNHCKNGKPPRCHHCSISVHIPGDNNGYSCAVAQFYKIFPTSQAPFIITSKSCCYLFGLRFCTLMQF